MMKIKNDDDEHYITNKIFYDLTNKIKINIQKIIEILKLYNNDQGGQRIEAETPFLDPIRNPTDNGSKPQNMLSFRRNQIYETEV